MLSRLKIGSRRSDLARLQAQMVGERLGATQFVFKEAPADVNLKDPLWKMPEMGVFTSFLRRYLLSKEIDLVVHSWKDLPVEKDPDSEIVATLPRADPRDLILIKKSSLPEVYASGKLVVLTSSPRRKHNLPEFLTQSIPVNAAGKTVKEIEFRDVRGNIQTRLSKLCSDSPLEDVLTGEVFAPHALVVAKAAIDRFLASEKILEFEKTALLVRSCIDLCHWQVLPLSVNPTAAAQGALAVEMLDREETKNSRIQVEEKINCHSTFAAVNEERRILQSLGGGCHQKIGCTILKREWGKVTFLRGQTDREKSDLKQIKIDCDSDFPRAKGEDNVILVGGQRGGLQLFDRFALEQERWAEKISKNDALYVSKHDALPPDFEPRNVPVWTSGVKSWFNLAQRGVWVNGSSDSLGENEPIDIDLIVGNKVEWIKLTHSQGNLSAEGRKFKACVPTYELRLKSACNAQYVEQKIFGKTHFFFSSGSAFKAVISLVPSLKEKFNQQVFVAGCGPGNTLELLRSEIGINNVVVAYNYQDFVRKVLPS